MSLGVHFRNPSCKLLYHLASTADDSGNSKTLTNNGSVTFPVNSLGACGASALFASSGQNLYRSSPGIDLSGAWTVRATFNLSEQIGGSGDYMSMFRVYDGALYFIVNYANIDAAGGIVLYMYLTSNCFVLRELTVGVPYHLVFTHDGAGTFTGYLNGRAFMTKTTTMRTTTSNYMRLCTTTTDENFHGNIDEFQFLAVCWTSQQVMRDYAWCKGAL